MNWYERRALLLAAAVNEPGWGCVRRVDDHNLGRVVMVRSRHWKPGLYRLDSPEYAALNHFFGAKQRAQTRSLPR